MADIAIRYKQNPLVSPKDLEPNNENMIIECLLNPGVFEFNGKIGLLVRVAERTVQKEGLLSVPIYNDFGNVEILDFDMNDPKLDASDARVISYNGTDYLTTISHLRLLFSDDGITFKEDKNYPSLFGEGDYGMIFSPHNKDCAIFEEKINDKYFALHRPSSPELGGNYIWLAESLDGIHWGNHKCIAKTRIGKFDSKRLGAGAAPIKTDKGWLEIYHGATEGNRYCLGAILLDLNDPSTVIARSEEPIMEPIAEYEQTGFFGNVVFTNGHTVDGDTIKMYYGASDEHVCLASFSMNQILKTLGQ